MPQAPTGGTPIARRVTIGVAATGVFAMVLVATWTQVAGLTRVDPRGRESWRSTPLAFDATPRDVSVFVPACDVDAVRLQPQPGGDGATGRVAIETFVAAADGSAKRSGQAVVLTPGRDGAYLLTLDAARPPWRAPLILRIRSLDDVLTLAVSAPLTLEPVRRGLGTLPCAFDGRSSRAWLAIVAAVLVVLTGGTMAAAWLARALGTSASAKATADKREAGEWSQPDGHRRTASAGRAVTALAAFAVGGTVLLYQLSVPPFEPPDELAHLQYARYVATTTSLPSAVPPPGSEWRASSYEWVQQPLYYLGAAAALRVAGLHRPAPQLTLNPRSRMQPRGTEPTIFQHGRPEGDRTGHRALALLRWLSLLMAVATTWLVARLTRRVTDDPLIVGTVAGGLALIPQWCAVMGAVSTDPPATLLAAAATLAIVNIGLGRVTPMRLVAAGAVIGAAYAVKATAAFLVPMACLAVAIATFDPIDAATFSADARRTVRSLIRPVAGRLAWLGAGVILVAGWIPLRAFLLYRDPLAFEFKRAILEAGGFVPTRGPMPWTWHFWADMRVMVFEPFWARFGSLGAGPFPASKVWLPYAAASVLLLALAAWAVLMTARAALPPRRLATVPPDARGRLYVVALCGLGVALGLGGWIAVNLAPRADMVVHWTPRHILPLTAPAAVLVAAGLEALRQRAWLSRPIAALTGLALVALAMAYTSVLRATLLMLHFGY
jgi:hypothetical protein